MTCPSAPWWSAPHSASGWASAGRFVTDAIWARTYDDVLGTPMTPMQALINLARHPRRRCAARCSFRSPWCGCGSPGVRESLDGFAIGALAALCFTAAGVLTRAAPEFANGLVADETILWTRCSRWQPSGASPHP